MSISLPSITDHKTYTSDGHIQTHTFPDVDVSGDDTIALAVGFNRNPASDVDGWTADSNAMSEVATSINGNVCAIQVMSRLINAEDVTVVCSTPEYRLQAGVAIGLENIDQDDPIEDTKTAGGWGTTASASYTGTEGNLLLVFVTTQNDKTYTPTNNTQLATVTHSDSSLGSGFVGYVTATGSEQTLGASWSDGDNWRIAIVELNAAGESIPKETKTHTVDMFVLAQPTATHTVDVSVRVPGEAVTTHTASVAVRTEEYPTGTFTPSDDFQSRISVELARFRAWAGEEPRLYLGEYGIPNDAGETDQPKWNAILEIIHKRAQADDYDVMTYWASGHRWGTTYNLSPYKSSTTPGTSWDTTPITDAHETLFQYKVEHPGVNYAGMEFGTDDALPANAPAVSDFEYHLNRGNQVLRYPLGEPSWTTQWLWNDVTHSLRANDLEHVEITLNRAQISGARIILDILHPGGGAKYATILSNGTRYNLSQAQGYEEYMLYADALLNHTFNDAYGNSVTLKNHPAVWAIDPVNEPQTLGSGASNTWLSVSQDIVDDFRDADGINYQGLLFVPLPHYSGVQDVNNNAPDGPWITDPADNFMYEGHYYPETSHIGNFDTTYDAEVASSSSFNGQGEFTYTVDSSTDTSTHTVDTLVRQTDTATHTLDTLAREEATAEHTVDMVVEDGAPKCYLLLEDGGKLLLEDSGALLLEQCVISEEHVHTVDMLVRSTETDTHTVDTLAREEREVTHTTDLLARAQLTEEHTVDVLVSEPGMDTVYHTADTAVRDTATSTHTVDTVARVSATATHTVDSLVRTSQTATHTADVLVRIVADHTHTIDSLVRAQAGVAHTVDTLVQATQATTHTTDVFVHEMGEELVSHTVDTVVRDSASVTHAVDTLVHARATSTHTVDALVTARATVVCTVDVLVRDVVEVVKTHTVDMLVKQVLDVTHTLDVVAKNIDTQTHTVDTLINRAEVGHSVDIAVYRCWENKKKATGTTWTIKAKSSASTWRAKPKSTKC